MAFELVTGNGEERIVLFQHDNPFSRIISLVAVYSGVFEVLAVECSSNHTVTAKGLTELVLQKAKVSRKEIYQHVKTISMNHHTGDAKDFPTPWLIPNRTIFEVEWNRLLFLGS
jgi:hypothetical protein